MSRFSYAVLSSAALWLGSGLAMAHDDSPATDAPRLAAIGPAEEISVALSPGTPAPVVALERGARVRLSVSGAAGQELHLHGYDVEVVAPASAPAVFEFEAADSGRYPVVAHGQDDLLGQREQAILYIEIRER